MMTDRYYTVDEIAELIQIHPKTVQRYIREGRLRANKVGKSWRVSGHDLSTFTEGSGASAAEAPIVPGADDVQRELRISAVVDIPDADTQASIRIANTLTALSNSKASGSGASSLQTQYLMSERLIRVMLWGGLDFIQGILDAIAMLTNQEEG